MVHWVDRLSRAVARKSLVREVRSSLPHESSAVIISEEETLFQAGLCQIMQRDAERSRTTLDAGVHAGGSLVGYFNPVMLMPCTR
jgi:hypothetical protein